jgi:hypothetical protein
MGAFFLYRKGSNPNLYRVRNLFSEKGFSQPAGHELPGYRLLLYRKILSPSTGNSHENGNDFICATGTLCYKGEDPEASIRELLKDYLNDRLDFNALFGHYFFLILKSDQLYFKSDPGNLYNLYYSSDQEIISSSFLAVCEALNTSLQINRKAVTEILATGSLVGPETIVTNIYRWNEKSGQSLGNLRLISGKPEVPDESYKDRSAAISDQLGTLHKYFTCIAPLADRLGVDSGLTGGLDSRLLFILAEKIFNKVTFHTHWRKRGSEDMKIASILCERYGKDLITVEVCPPWEMDESGFFGNLRSSFLFSDGHIRTNYYWIEQYNTLEHRKKVLDGKLLGLHGIGGEQYRGYGPLRGAGSNLKTWIRKVLITRTSGDCFCSKQAETELVQHLEEKINFLLELEPGSKLTGHTIKRYENEIYNPSNRGLNTNAENQASWFLSPFAEYSVSHNAYRVIPFLGNFLDFEMDMIHALDPGMAGVPTSYGFDLKRKTPLRYRENELLKNALPGNFYFWLKRRKWAGSNPATLASLLERFRQLSPIVDNVRELRLPVRLDHLFTVPDIFPLILEIGYFMEAFRDKIE